jgi:hypothetical protein
MNISFHHGHMSLYNEHVIVAIDNIIDVHTYLC